MKQRFLTMLLAFASFFVFAAAAPPGTLYYGRLQGYNLTTAQRLALTPGSPGTLNGTVVYDTTLNELFGYTNGNWFVIGQGGGAGSIVLVTNTDGTVSVTGGSGPTVTLSAAGLSNSLTSEIGLVATNSSNYSMTLATNATNFAQSLSEVDVLLSPSGGSDVAQIQNALNLLTNQSVTIRFARGVFIIDGTLVAGYNSQLYVPVLNPTNAIRTLTLEGQNAAPFWNANANDLPNFHTGAILKSTLTGQGGTAALIRATNFYSLGAGIVPNAVNVIIRNLSFQTTSNLTAVDMNGIGDLRMDSVAIYTGTLNSVTGFTQPTNTLDYGLSLPSNNFPTTSIRVSHVQILNHYTGILLGEQAGDLDADTVGCIWAIQVPFSYHGNQISRLGDYRNQNGINVTAGGPTTLQILFHDIEEAYPGSIYSSWMNRTNDVYDPNGKLVADIGYLAIQSGTGSAEPYVVVTPQTNSRGVPTSIFTHSIGAPANINNATGTGNTFDSTTFVDTNTTLALTYRNEVTGIRFNHYTLASDYADYVFWFGPYLTETLYWQMASWSNTFGIYGLGTSPALLLTNNSQSIGALWPIYGDGSHFTGITSGQVGAQPTNINLTHWSALDTNTTTLTQYQSSSVVLSNLVSQTSTPLNLAGGTNLGPQTNVLLYSSTNFGPSMFYGDTFKTNGRYISSAGEVFSNAVGSVTLAGGNVTATGTISGNAGSLTNLQATNLIGTVPTNNLGTGTANSTTYLRGDQTWATPSSSGFTFPYTNSFFIPFETISLAGSSALTLTANTVYCLMDTVSVPTYITNIIFYLNTGATGGHVGFSIFEYITNGHPGARLFDTGPIASTTSASYYTNAVTAPGILNPGQYIFAYTQATTNQLFGSGGLAAGLIAKGSTGPFGNASVASTNGQIPSSIGTITLTASTPIPAMRYGN